MNQYREIPNPTEHEVEGALSANESDSLKVLVIGAALHWGDRVAVENLCSRLGAHQNEEVRGNAILALGHLARRFEMLSSHFRFAIRKALSDESKYVRGQALAAADDVEIFLGWELIEGPKMRIEGEYERAEKAVEETRVYGHTELSCLQCGKPYLFLDFSSGYVIRCETPRCFKVTSRGI